MLLKKRSASLAIYSLLSFVLYSLLISELYSLSFALYSLYLLHCNPFFWHHTPFPVIFWVFFISFVPLSFFAFYSLKSFAFYPL